MSFKRTNRTIHKWASIVIALPFIVILVTGILLLVKKEVDYIQPSTIKGSSKTPTITFNKILEQVKKVDVANIQSWEDVNRLDIRPNKGIIKVRTNSHWEVQLDASTGEILKTAFRRSDIIEQLHDATFWQQSANLWFSLPIAIALLVISITGVILFFMPYFRRNKRNR